MDRLVIPEHLTFYRGRRVLLTGDTGFKGSWLALWLTELGADVLGLALAPPPDTLGMAVRVSGAVRHTTLDICDYKHVALAVGDFRPEVVFHLAAQAIVRTSYEEPRETFETNVGGTINILEAVRTTECVGALVCVTSDKCYVNKEWVWGYRENDELGGRDPYSASKAAAELAFAAYSESFFSRRTGLGAATVRAGNVIGGGDASRDRIVPDCMQAFIQGRAVVLRNPGACRPWQHVLEPLGGYLRLGEALARAPRRFTGAWNFGPPLSSVWTVQQIAERLRQEWGGGDIELAPEADAPHEAEVLALSSDKAHRLLGWSPQWPIERGIHETVRWFRAVHEGADAVDVTR